MGIWFYSVARLQRYNLIRPFKPPADWVPSLSNYQSWNKITIAIRAVEFFKWGIQNWKDFCVKINTPKENYWTFSFGLILSNIGHHFSNKFILKKLRKIHRIFDIKNWLWESNFGTFLQLAINPKLKIQYFPLGMLILRQKSLQFCIPHLKAPQPVLPYRVRGKQYLNSNSRAFKGVGFIFLLKSWGGGKIAH